MFDNVTFKNARVKGLLEILYLSKDRVRVFYGSEGKIWNEEHDVIGTIGRSTGKVKIPLLVHNSRSFGGEGLLIDRIVGVFDTKTGRRLFWDEGYQFPAHEIIEVSNAWLLDKGYKFSLLIGGEVYSNHKNEAQAKRLSDFMLGKRFAK